MDLASNTIKRDYRNSYTYGTNITIKGDLEINSTITFAANSTIYVSGNVKVGKNGVLDMRKGGKLEVGGYLEFKSTTDHSNYKVAIILYEGLKALKEQGLLSAASISLKNYDKYFYHANDPLYVSDSLSSEEMRRVSMALVELLEGKWYKSKVINIEFNLFVGSIPVREFSYFDNNGNIKHYKVGIPSCMVTKHGAGEIGWFKILYARGNEKPRECWVYQNPEVTQNQMNACYRAITYQGLDSIKEIKKWVSGDIVEDAAIFIVTQMANVIGDKSIPEAFAAFDKKHKKILLDIIEG